MDIKDLAQHRGSQTNLITLAVPAGGDLTKSRHMIEHERGAQSKIKSPKTRSEVQDALAGVKELLKCKTIPPNGLVIFCGHAQSKNAGQLV